MKNFKVVVCGVLDHGKSTFCDRVLLDYEAIKTSDQEIDAKPIQTIKLGTTNDSGKGIWNSEDKSEKNSRVQYLYTNYARIEIIDHFGGEEAFDKLASSFLTADHISLVIDGNRLEDKEIFFYLKLALRLTRGRVSVLINKMDQWLWSEDKFKKVRKKIYAHVVDEERLRVKCIPIAASKGINIYIPAPQMPWYTEDTVFQNWRRSFTKKKREVTKTDPLFFVQRSEIFKTLGLFQGVLLQGQAQVGDKLLGLPDRKPIEIKKIYTYDQECKLATSGAGVTFLTDNPDALGSQFIVKEALSFHIANKVTARIYLWGGKLEARGEFTLKHYSKVFRCKVTQVLNFNKRSDYLNEAVVEFKLEPQFTYQKVDLSTGLGTFSVCDLTSGQPVGLGIL